MNVLAPILGVFFGLYLAVVLYRIIVPVNDKSEYGNGCSGWLARIFDAFIWPGDCCFTHFDVDDRTHMRRTPDPNAPSAF